jgi:hypothetical protein
MENLLCFWCLEYLPVPHMEKLLWFCEVLLVVSFPTKLVSSHSEFPCKSYLVFGLSSSAPGPARPGSRPDLPAVDRTSPAWERTTIRARVSVLGRKFQVGHRTVRSPIRRRRTYGQTGRRAASNGHIFPTYLLPP